MNFKKFLIENTIAQSLKKPDREFIFKKLKDFLRTFRAEWANTHQISDNFMVAICNFFIFNFQKIMEEKLYGTKVKNKRIFTTPYYNQPINLRNTPRAIPGEKSSTDFGWVPGERDITDEMMKILIHEFGHYVTVNFFPIRDYLVAMKEDNQLKSNLNNTFFSMEDLIQKSEEWHEDQANKKVNGPGGEGELLINLEAVLGSSWAGWKWLSLDRGYCKKEGESGGHCGNASFRAGDNILSLRDSKNSVQATFIENKGVLGEMKGKFNNKPSEKLFPAIVQLLKHPKIKSMKGGGYLSGNNFDLNDLPENIREELIKSKPHLDDYLGYLFNSYKFMNNKDILHSIEELFNDNFEEVVSGSSKEDKKEKYLILDKYKNIESFSENFPAKYDDSGEIFDLGKILYSDFYSHYDRLSENFDFSLEGIFDYLSIENYRTILEKFGYERNDYLEISDIKDSELEQTMIDCARDAFLEGYEKALHKRVKEQLSEPGPYGFFVKLPLSNNDYVKVCVPFKEIEKILREMEIDEETFVDFLNGELNVGLRTYAQISYSHSDNFYDFDKNLFNDMLKEKLKN